MQVLDDLCLKEFIRSQLWTCAYASLQVLNDLYFENYKNFKEEEARQMEAAEAAHRRMGPRGVSALSA